MNKKLFGILIALMSLSLLGIIFVQGYWIKNAYQTKQEQYTVNVRNALVETAKKIQLSEVQYYYAVYNEVLKEIDSTQEFDINDLFDRINSDRDEEVTYTDDIVEQDFKMSSGFFDIDNDSFNFQKISRQREGSVKAKAILNSGINGIQSSTFSRLKDYEKAQFENAFKSISSKEPIHKRISNAKINTIVRKELLDRGIVPEFEYAIYSGDFATKVRSSDFELNPETTYSVALFVNDKQQSRYQLYLNFYNQEYVVLNEILSMAILSLIFTGVIILTFYYAIKQIFEQRQISQIKTDFINNMTHEFKTPIATINLALDALKNPKVKDNKEFLTRYLGMIREENKRMHTQVESVLRISKLEKNELDLPKNRIDMHELIEDAITHVELLVEDREGYINLHLGALKNTVLGNEDHLTNVIVNLLDNAIKYTDETKPPKIDIFTETVKNTFVLKIRDQGAGMTKNVQKRIFEKFYREHTGDIHNVKGHGLGLAYVKRILDDHDAQIEVQSDINKGSTFIIKLHLIT